MECEFCKKTLSTVSSLRLHQKSTKYCLKLQNKCNTMDYTCDYCTSSFQIKSILKVHQKTCKIGIKQNNEINDLKQTCEKIIQDNDEIIHKKDDEINELKQLIQDKERQINELKHKYETLKRENVIIMEDKVKLMDKLSIGTTNNTTNNNNTMIFLQNAEPISEDYIKDQVVKLTYDQHVRGIDGYVEHYDSIVKNRIVSSDPSRNKIEYKTPEGQIVKELGYGYLFTNLCKNILDRTKQLSDEHKRQLSEEFTPEEMGTFDIYKIYNAIRRSSKGNETVIGNKILKKLCQKNIAG